MFASSLLIIAIISLLLLAAAGVVLTALQLPGTWLMIAAAAVYAWYRWGLENWSLSWTALVVLLALALLGELIEFIAGAAGSRSAGGSRRGAGLAIIGGVGGAIVGSFTIPIPIIGTLLGAALGASVGSSLGDKWAGRTWNETVRGAGGAFVGKLTGSVLKLIVAVVMWISLAVALVV